MKEIGTTNLSTSHCKFNGAHSCAHTQKTILLAPIYLFTKQIRSTFIVSIIVYLKLVEFVFCMCLIKCLLATITFLHACHFFVFVVSFYHTLMWACRSLCESQKFFFNHSLVWPITHSFLNRFQPNLYQDFSYVCSTCHTIFSLK